MRRFLVAAQIAVLAIAYPGCGVALSAGLAIAPASPPGGTQGAAYSVTLGTSGGTAPYTWSLSNGTLPAGLLINAGTGTISGVPTTTGLVTFTVQVVDSALPPRSGTRTMSINVTSLGTQYDPPWGTIAATTTIPFTYNGSQTSAQNGTALRTAINALVAGDKLVISAGTYTISSFFNLTCSALVTAPIFIEAAAGASVIIVQSNSGQNILDVGSGSHVEYVAIRGIEWTGGSEGVRFHDCANVWFDRNHVHNTPAAALTANSQNTDHLYITRNEINDTGGTGEGMYLGGNAGSVIMHDSIIALNHVHDTNGPTVTQGDGIELKQGSWGNRIAENLVHDCGYPCILVDGTAGLAQNIVERNTCYNSGDNVLQIQGECIVRNNLAMNGAGSAFASQNHQGAPTNLQVVHNTFINTGDAANLNAWSGASSMTFANNVCYSKNGNALRFVPNAAGVTLAGNVVSGGVQGTAVGFIATANPTPLTDFTNVAWDASQRNALPVAVCTIISAGNGTYAVTDDITGATRVSGLEPGCFDRP